MPSTAQRDALVIRGLPLVRRIAIRLARRLPAYVDIDDLISSGHLGLVEAGAAFDPTKSASFESYAEYRIRGAMIDDLREGDSLTRYMRALSNELRDAARDAESTLGRTPGQEEIAEHLGITVDELHARQRKLTGSTVIGIDDAGPDLLEHTADEMAADPIDAIARMETIAMIEAAALTLPDRIRAALVLGYRDGLNLKQIGDAMGYSESRACQVMREAIVALRAALHMQPTG